MLLKLLIGKDSTEMSTEIITMLLNNNKVTVKCFNFLILYFSLFISITYFIVRKYLYFMLSIKYFDYIFSNIKHIHQ